MQVRRLPGDPSDVLLRRVQQPLAQVAQRARHGELVADPGSDDPMVVGTQRGLELLGSDPRVDATALQTVGSKGWDGFAVAIVV